MKSAQTYPDRRLRHLHWTSPRGEFMTPLPPRRARRTLARFDPELDWDQQEKPVGSGNVHGPLRGFAVLLLMLLLILSLMWLVAEFGSLTP